MSAQRLTVRQRQYIWLMGSYSHLLAEQGRGVRSKELLYGLTDEAVVIFGYSSPFFWLKNRGLVRQLENSPRHYVLTEAGEAEFRKLVLSGAALDKIKGFRKVKVKERSDA